MGWATWEIAQVDLSVGHERSEFAMITASRLERPISGMGQLSSCSCDFLGGPRQTSAFSRKTLSRGGEVSGTSMSKPLPRRSRDFFAGVPNLYSASPGSGCQEATYGAGSSHHNEVVPPQSPGAESGRIIPRIVASSFCLPMSPEFPPAREDPKKGEIFSSASPVSGAFGRRRGTCRKLS